MIKKFFVLCAAVFIIIIVLQYANVDVWPRQLKSAAFSLQEATVKLLKRNAQPATASTVGPIAHYTLNEGIGSLVYDEVSTNVGTTVNTTRVQGISGGALNFNGSNSYVTLGPGPSVQSTSAITLSAWIKPTLTGTSQTILGKETNSLDANPYRIRIQGQNNIRFNIRTGSGNTALNTTTGPITGGVWQLITGTWDGATMRIYRNGSQLVSSAKTGTFSDTSTDLRIGRTSFNTLPFKGVIDDVRIYDRALSAQEVLDLYNTVTMKTPLNDLGAQTYLGFQGGLYENGTNAVPSDHNTAGLQKVGLVTPRDSSGNPSPSGKIGLLSIGYSNVTQEWCSKYSTLPCDSWTFTGQALINPLVNASSLVIADGARAAQVATTWDSPTDTNYDTVKNTILPPLGLTEQQIQAVWIKAANSAPTSSLPSPSADVHNLLRSMGNIARAMKIRYPNLQQVFFSDRIYAGYATIPLNPEPYAYENGLAVKWLIQAQIDQMRSGSVHPVAGNLDYGTVAPWISWGPYLWANGTTPRSDGLTWLVSDFESDGTHPGQPAEQKVGTMLLNFFLSSPYTQPWFAP